MKGFGHILLAAALLLILEWTAAAQSQDAKQGSGTITGVVTVDGKAARRIAVNATPWRSGRAPDSLQAQTDDDGRFRLSGLIPGEYIIKPSGPTLVAAEDEPYDRQSRT